MGVQSPPQNTKQKYSRMDHQRNVFERFLTPHTKGPRQQWRYLPLRPNVFARARFTPHRDPNDRFQHSNKKQNLNVCPHELHLYEYVCIHAHWYVFSKSPSLPNVFFSSTCLKHFNGVCLFPPFVSFQYFFYNSRIKKFVTFIYVGQLFHQITIPENLSSC